MAVGTATLADFLEGGVVAWATERQLELVGEALGKLRQAAPEIAERVPNVHKVIGMRNVLIHGYLVVNPRIVYRAATEQVPELIPVLETLLIELAPPGS
ncbi:DUF86 domain-containing protein [Microbacterium sp. C7(2022)]|uniref:DUF86 domain-containing protein n=1 Tax=Microbacterium sp. C7(2022) TaxID=2992759 RepID=UPI0034D5BEBE